MTNPRKLVLQATMLLLIILGCVLLAQPARSASLEQFTTVAVGANGFWLDGSGAGFPADFEGGGSVSVALHERIKVGGNLYYGFTRSYLRGDGNLKIVMSDKANDDFNVYLVGKRRFGSTADVRPDEWALGAGFGVRPFPTGAPRFTAGVDATRGLSSDLVHLYVFTRYALTK